MAPEKKPDTWKPPVLRVFPTNLRPGDVLADEIAEWRVIGHPFSIGGGKTVNVRVESVKQPGVTQMRAWDAHERVAVLDERTPEQFLECFAYRNSEYPLDPQFSVGLQIIDEWLILFYRETVSQADLDGLLARFTRDAEGMQIYDLWVHVVRWGVTRGLSVPDGHPWEPR